VTSRIPRVGIISPAESDATPIFQAFRQGLRERGYAEGLNIALEFRLARFDYSAFPRLVAELLSIPVDVIVTDGGPGPVRIIYEANKQIPVVMGAGPDPVALGLAQSLARPGGNVTGFTLMPDLAAKRVDLLRTAFPDATRVTVVLNPSNEGSEGIFRVTEQAARSVGFATTRLEAADPKQLSIVNDQHRVVGKARWINHPKLFRVSCFQSTGCKAD
jgi:putative tryptophan/tyrosine transport system substrate-binding protein